MIVYFSEIIKPGHGQLLALVQLVSVVISVQGQFLSDSLKFPPGQKCFIFVHFRDRKKSGASFSCSLLLGKQRLPLQSHWSELSLRATSDVKETKKAEGSTSWLAHTNCDPFPGAHTQLSPALQNQNSVSYKPDRSRY